MTSAWGEAWDAAWGDSWGAVTAPVEPETPNYGGGTGGAGGIAIPTARRKYRVDQPRIVEVGGGHHGAHYGVASLEVTAEIGGTSRGESVAILSVESLAEIGGASRGQSRVMATVQAIDNRRNARTLAILLTVLRNKP